jgi:serine protease Do
MNKKFGFATLVIVALSSLAAGVALVGRLDLTETTEAQPFWREPAPKALASFTAPSFAELAKQTMPAVVNISTTQTVKRRVPFPEFRSPFEEFFGDEFREFFEERDIPRQSLGSGFIINKDGYILTNNHVIEDAEEIIVAIAGKKKREYRATVVGKDEKLDVALIKIDDEKDLSTLSLGNSDALEIGEWVIAIGNPFGLGGTLTAGIVSQKGRVIGAGPYDDFIQTDAAINPGNSGGPLINMRGEVVGINTAIIAGGQGIGFATPINIVKEVLPQIKEKGMVVRGWIGVTIQGFTPDMAESFGLKEPKGALVASVMEGDPAEKAGIKPGDIIIEFNGTPIEDMADLPRTVAATAPGRTVKVKVIRERQEKEFSLTVGAMGKEAVEEKKPEKPALEEKLGITVTDITPQLAQRLGIKDEKGVFVHDVKPGALAQRADIRRGDIIKEVNGRPIKNTKEFRESLAGKIGVVRFYIRRGDSMIFATIRIKE